MAEQNVVSLDVARVVRLAARGDDQAWERLVAQYARLIWAITRDFRLMESDAADVAQATWLHLLENIDRLESPARVGSWLATTATRECLHMVAAHKKVVPVPGEVAFSDIPDCEPGVDEHLLADDRTRVVRDALSCLPEQWQQLLELLMADPPIPYSEISHRLGLPVGSIGPTRARSLARLRQQLAASLQQKLMWAGLLGRDSRIRVAWTGGNGGGVPSGRR